MNRISFPTVRAKTDKKTANQAYLAIPPSGAPNGFPPLPPKQALIFHSGIKGSERFFKGFFYWSYYPAMFIYESSPWQFITPSQN
jgi:hypothetical protein